MDPGRAVRSRSKQAANLSLQLFLFFTAAPFMALAALVEERKVREQALRQRDSELNEAQRLAQIGSWQWDPRSDAVTWSAELYRLAGYDPELPQRMALLAIGIDQLEQGMPELSSTARQQIHDLGAVTAEVSSIIHNLSHQLHPSKLNTLGLVASLGGLVPRIRHPA
jgi:PAS domain-containing protein